MKKTYLTSAIILTTFIALRVPVFAANSTNSAMREEKKEIRQDKKDLRQDVREYISSRAGMIKNVFDKHISLAGATITTISPTSLIVTKDGKTITVQIETSTNLRRHYWGKATTSEMQIGDIVNVIGSWKDDTKTTIIARLIRDISIQKRFGIFVGSVQSILGNTMVIQTEHRGTQTATVGTTTKYTDRKGSALTVSQIQVGNKIRIRGMWDKTNNTITEVTHIKDYSLPVQVTPTPKP